MKTLHPLPCFICFMAILIFTAIQMNPFFIIISLVFAFAAAIQLKGAKALKIMVYVLPLCLFAAVINALFVNRGSTVLFVLSNGNTITLESVIYSLCSSGMILSFAAWFISFSEIMTSDKVIYLFGGILPSLGLLVSMTLKAIPDFSRRVKECADAQRFVGNDIYSGSIKSRIKSAVTVISSGITASIESAAESAQSMKNRGYGSTRRTRYTRYRFSSSDITVLCASSAAAAILIAVTAAGKAGFSFYPQINAETDIFSVLGYICMMVLCAVPSALTAVNNLREQSFFESRKNQSRKDRKEPQ